VLSPIIRVKAAQHRIINNIDHGMIRDSVLPLLENSAQRFIEPDDWPECVAMTEPKSVCIANGQVFIEYAGALFIMGSSSTRTINSKQIEKNLSMAYTFMRLNEHPENVG